MTFAAGLAAEGMKPFCAIYSTFLQRAYDQVVHDVAIQSLPVRFAMDRAGLVGADGATHAGIVRHRLSRHLAQFRGDGAGGRSRTDPHGRHRRRTSTTGPAPSAIRAAKAPASHGPPKAVPLAIGKGRIIREGSGIAILTFGTRLTEVLLAAEKLSAYGLSPTIADARFAKPLDTDLIRRLAREHEVLITIEEGAAGGFGSPCDAVPGLGRAARQGPQDPAHDPAGRLPGPGHARAHVCRRRAWTPTASSRWR